MKSIFKKMVTVVLAVVTVLVFIISQPGVTAFAATYRNGAQSGPSSSYKSGKYYTHYTNVPITGDNRTDLLAIALSQLGYQEGASNGAFSGLVSGSANYVEFSYNLGDLGLGYGGTDYPWCASFVTWCLYQSRCTDQATYSSLGRFHKGDYTYIWKEISCSQWVSQLKGAGYYKYSNAEGGTYTPKSGDLVFFQNSGGVAHIGICLYTKNGRIYTIEGNTSDSSGLEANGGGVYFKNYALTSSYLHGYGVLPYKTNDSVPKIDYSGANPTEGLYISNSVKYIYSTETATSYSATLPRFAMFEVTDVCSNGRLKIKYGSTVGYINNNTDRVIQLSSTATTVDPTADERATLKTLITKAEAARHYNYSEAAIITIREAYAAAVVALAKTDKTTAVETQLKDAITGLTNALNNTGSNTIAMNNKGIYINARNKSINNGDCVLFTSDFNNGLVTVENANIRYTINVVFGWDADKCLNVVKSISVGTGDDTPDIQLGTSDILIAAHVWEGEGVSNPVEYSSSNYKILNGLKVGDAIKLSGASRWDVENSTSKTTGVEACAYAKFFSTDDVWMTDRNKYVEPGHFVLFTPEFNGGVITPANANIHNTLNIISKWDNANGAWVVEDKFVGNGVADESSNITIADGRIVISGLAVAGVSDTADGTQENYANLNNAQIGDKIVFSGISPTSSSYVSIGANLHFEPLEEDAGSDNVGTGGSAPLSGLNQGNDGNWYYFTEGEVDDSFTGIVENGDEWWYIVDGAFASEYTGIVKKLEELWYIEAGKFNPDFNGMFYNVDEWIYVTAGKVDNTYSGLAQNSEGWWYLQDGVIDTSFTGLMKKGEEWWYFKAGKYDDSFTGMVYDSGDVSYVKSGKFDDSYTGMVVYEGKCCYVSKGKLDLTYTGLAKNSKGIWYIKNGVLDLTYTGMVKNAYGVWYMKNGKLDTTYTGMVLYGGKCCYVKKGKLDLTYTGLAKNSKGVWYMKNGVLDLTYTGMAKNAYGVWYMKDGKLDTTYTGLVLYGGKCCYVNNGKLDLTYTGIAKNAAGWWYMENGVFDATYTGTVEYEGQTYSVTNGKVAK